MEKLQQVGNWFCRLVYDKLGSSKGQKLGGLKKMSEYAQKVFSVSTKITFLIKVLSIESNEPAPK